MALKRQTAEFAFDVCLSFAGEDRDYVRQVAVALKDRGIRVFYDEYEQAGLWGKDLYEHLDDVYQNSARYCVIFVSKHYATKLWTNHERKSAQTRALREHQEYILPALLDKTEIPGVRKTVGHVNLAQFTPARFAELIVKKIGKTERQNYLPPNPDRLFRLRMSRPRELALERAHSFLTVLTRMSADERELIFGLFQEGCTIEVPKNVHISVDLLRRITGFPITKIKRLLAGLPSLGFVSSLRESDGKFGTLGKSQIIAVEWHEQMIRPDQLDDNATAFAGAMIALATEGLCPECGMATLRRLDFSQLGTRTANRERHKRRTSKQSGAGT